MQSIGASPQSAISEFKNEIYKSRCARAMVSVVFHLLLAYLVAVIPLAIINTSISSIPGHWWSILHPASWIYLALIVALTCAMGFTHVAWYTLKPASSLSWLSRISKLWNIHILGTIASHIIISTMMARSFLGLFGSRHLANLFENCLGSDHYKCINEWHLFLVCQAGFNGLSCSISYFLDNNNLVSFPIVQQKLSERIWHSIKTNLSKSLSENLHTMKWFYLLYLIQGGWICSFITRNLDATRDGIPVDSILGLLSIPLFLNTLVLGSLLRYTVLMALSTFEIYHTQSFPMELSSMAEANQPLVLTAALETPDFPLLQCLAYHELADLGRKSAEKRTAVFCLSQPGGHPHTWNQLSTSSLGQITGLTQKLEAALSPSTSDNNNQASKDETRHNFHGLRDLTAGFSPRSPAATMSSNQFSFDWSTILKKLRQWAERRPILGPLLTEPADARCMEALASSICTHCAVSGLTALTVASYKEDKYGVAQHQLPQLLSALLSLSTALERARRLSVTATTKTGVVQRRAAALRHNVTTCLFRLTATFGSHLRALGLPDEVLSKLEPYRAYSEG